MVTKNLKLRTVLTLALVAVCMICAFAFTSVSPAKANTNVVFEMNTEAQVRIASPSGIRFVAKMNEATKTIVQSQGSEFGFLVAPSAYFTDEVVSNGKYHDKYSETNTDYQGLYDYVIVEYKTENAEGTNDFDKIHASAKEDGVYLANGVLANIKEANLDLDFTAVAYYKASGDTDYTYATLDNSALKKNIHSIVSKEYLNAELPADTEALVDAFNLGSETANAGKPALSVLITDEQDFSAMLSKQDTAWYQLANDITIAQAADGTPNYSYETTLTGILDGNGNKLSVVIEYSTVASDNQQYKGIVKDISGTVKNIIIDSQVSAPANTGSTSVLCKTLTGTIKDTVFITNYNTNSTGISMTSGLIETVGANATVSNVLNYDKSSGRNLVLSMYADSTAVIENFAYIGNSYNKSMDGYGNYPWRRFPNAVANSTQMPTVTGMYIYQSGSTAISGTALHLTGYITSGQDPDVANGTGDPFDFTGYAGNRDICTTENIIKPISQVLKAPFSASNSIISYNNLNIYPEKLVEITTAQQFADAMFSGESNIFDLKADVKITSAELSSIIGTDGTMGTKESIFENFNGVLLGNKHKVEIVIPDGTGYFSGMIRNLNGTIKDVNFIVDMTGNISLRQNTSAGGSGVIAENLYGTLMNSIVSFKVNQVKYSSAQHWVAAVKYNFGAIDNCVIINTNYDDPSTSSSESVWIAGPVIANKENAKINDVVVISEAKSWGSLLEYAWVAGKTHPADIVQTLNIADLYHYSGMANALNGVGRYLDVDYYKANCTSYGGDNTNSAYKAFYKELTTAQGNTKTPDNVVSGFTFTADGASFAN